MDGLIFDDPSLNDGEPKEEESPQEAQQKAIDFSNILVGLFTDISEEEDQISLDELRQVYLEAGRNVPEEQKNINLWALAKMNMFVRMKSQKEIKISAEENQELKNLKEITGLELEMGDSEECSKGEINTTKSWLPLNEDFNLAESYIQKYNLDFSFSNVDDLYIEKYEAFKVSWY